MWTDYAIALHLCMPFENDFLVSYCELTLPLNDIDVYSQNDLKES